MNEQTAGQLMRGTMADKAPVTVTLSIWQVWLLVSAAQLSTHHPELSEWQKTQITEVAQQLQDTIVERHPEAEPVLEWIWDPESDTVEEDPRS